MKNIIVLTLLAFSITTVAQNYDFGKVSKEELQEKYNPLDSSASATYLYKYRRTFFEYSQNDGFQLITEIHERVKIYNQEGFEYATYLISLYKNSANKEKSNGLKAYTYNLINGKIEESKLKKNAIFETETSKFRNEVKFTMPNIKEGSVIEYKYKIVSPFTINVDEFKFQHNIPIKKLVAKFEAPEYYKFKINTKGFLHINPEAETKRGKISFTNNNRDEGTSLSTSYGSMGNVKKRYSTSNVEFNIKVSNYNLSNIPALKEEQYVNNINNYRSAVKYELSYVKFPNELINYYTTTWEDVVKTIYESPNFGSQLDKTGYYEDDVNNLIGSITDHAKKTALIYNFVKSKVKWNGYYGKYTNDGVTKAYKEQVGNVAEINLMLTSMLRYVGVNANPVLVSTRQNGIPLFPTREGYNYVISCIEVPNGVILLDATNKYSSPNVLPFRVLNWKGRIIRKRGSSALISLYPKEKSKNTVTMMVNLSANGDIHGMKRTVKTSHKAMSYRESYLEADKDHFLEKLENKYNGIEVSDFEVKNGLDLSKPVIETFKFSIENQADIIGDKMYFSPLFFLTTTENPFKLEKREFPIDFGYPSTTKYMVNINLPEGYFVELLPEPKAFALPENLGKFKYMVANKGNTIQLILDTAINESIISPLYYDALKEYFKQFIEKENEKIVLSKKVKP